MAPNTISPNVDNLQVGKGKIEFKKLGDVAFRHLGNCSGMVITPEVDTIEHFTSLLGTKKKDLVIVIDQKAHVKITMEEFTPANLALMVYGNVDEAAIGGPTVDIFANFAITGALRFTGTNDVGPKIFVDLYKVSFTPSGDLNMISDDFNSMEVTAEVLAKDGVQPIAAVGTYTATANLANADTITINGVVYTFDAALAATPNHVKIGANLAATLASFVKAINLTGIAGTDYGAGTVINPDVSATGDATHVFLTAKLGGVAPNSYATTDTSANGAFGAVTLTGGVAGDVQAGKFGTAQFTNTVVGP